MNILENGLDSLKKGIILLNSLDDFSNDISIEFKKKDLIISIHHAIETLFKYILKQKNLLLIYENVDKVCDEFLSKNVHNLEDFNITISFMSAVKRLYVACKRPVNPDLIKKFSYFNDYRNAITHSELNFNNKHVEHLIAIIIPELLDVFQNELPDFKEFLGKNNLDSEMEINYELGERWNYENLLELVNKYLLAISEYEKLKKEPKNLEKIFQDISHDEKDKLIEYVNCPICLKRTFYKTGTIIYQGEEIFVQGTCKLCKVHFSKTHAYYINLFETYKTVKNDFIECLVNEVECFLTEYGSKFLSKASEDERVIWRTFYKLNKEKIDNNLKELLVDDMLIEAITESKV